VEIICGLQVGGLFLFLPAPLLALGGRASRHSELLPCRRGGELPDGATAPENENARQKVRAPRVEEVPALTRWAKFCRAYGAVHAGMSKLMP